MQGVIANINNACVPLSPIGYRLINRMSTEEADLEAAVECHVPTYGHTRIPRLTSNLVGIQSAAEKVKGMRRWKFRRERKPFPFLTVSHLGGL